MSMQSGSGTATLYVSGSVLPTDTLYDNKTQAQSGKSGFIYVDTTQLTGSPAFVFGYITGDQSTAANVTLNVVTPNQGTKHHHTYVSSMCRDHINAHWTPGVWFWIFRTAKNWPFGKLELIRQSFREIEVDRLHDMVFSKLSKLIYWSGNPVKQCMPSENKVGFEWNRIYYYGELHI